MRRSKWRANSSKFSLGFSWRVNSVENRVMRDLVVTWRLSERMMLSR